MGNRASDNEPIKPTNGAAVEADNQKAAVGRYGISFDLDVRFSKRRGHRHVREREGEREKREKGKKQPPPPPQYP